MAMSVTDNISHTMWSFLEKATKMPILGVDYKRSYHWIPAVWIQGGDQKHPHKSESLAGCAASHFLPGYIEGGRGGLPLRLALRSAPEGHVEPCEY